MKKLIQAKTRKITGGIQAVKKCYRTPTGVQALTPYQAEKGGYAEANDWTYNGSTCVTTTG